jgi:thiol-disulfide isomerase/thioredoxin
VSGPWIAGFVALWVVTLLTATLVLGLLRRVNMVLDSAEKRLVDSMAGAGFGGAAPGTTIAPFEAALNGATVSSDELVPGVFVFMSTACEPCKALAKELGKVGERVDDVPVYAVFEDTPDAREYPLPPNVRVLYQRERAVSTAFDTTSTPQAFAVDATATVVEQMIPGTAKHVRELAARCRVPTETTSV